MTIAFLRAFALALLMTGCAQIEGKGLWCVGACVQVEAKKGEAPIDKVGEVISEVN